MRIVAVVLGGGMGLRLGAAQPKQLLTLNGRTLIEHCVAAFEQAPAVDEILVVMAAGYLDQVKSLVADYPKVTGVIEGGLTRSGSTRAALAAIRAGQDDPGVLLHDAARPLVDQRIIADCAAALTEHGHDAAGTAAPVSDTIVVTANGAMHSIPDRATLMRCQTPQCFRLSVITRAHELAAADPGFVATDDCGVVLRYLPDTPVHIVAGSEHNLKITYPGDLAVAEALLTRGTPPA